MEGVREGSQYGISYRTIQKIFHLLKLRAQQQRTAEILVGVDSDSPERVSFQYSLQVGMLEIYNDEIYDLLTASGSSMREKKEESIRAGGKASLEIRRSPEGRIEVPNLTKESVTGIDEVMKILERGNSNRATASTDMNEHSSRSHMVLIVEVTSGMGEANQNTGTLFLVDLAGSERVRRSNVDGDHLKEAGHINKSLAALGNVMEALDRKASHIPYRDSKLTYLLQDSLGGNSRTMMVVATSPQDASYDETVHALQFATRVRRIQIGAAQRNVTSKNLEETVKTLTDEMRTLTRAKERTELQLNTLKRDNGRVQEKLENLAKSKSQSRSDNKTLEVLKKNNDDMAARWQKEKVAREEVVEELEKRGKECRVLQQQIGKYKSKAELLEQRIEDKERALEQAHAQLRQERNQTAATTVRARRNEVMRNPVAVKTKIPSTPVSLSSSSPVSRPVAAVRSSVAPTTSLHVGGEACSDADMMTATGDADISIIREQVLLLLEKYDQAKVDRIDIIMEKFKGKESLLLEKMSQRYEGSSAVAGATSGGAAPSSSSIQQRNAMALQRHQERMKKIHEKKTKGGG
jgi:Kinesin motor domain